MPERIEIFDKEIKKIHRDRATKNLTKSDFLIRECESRLADIFNGEIIKKFPTALNIGARTGKYSNKIIKNAGVTNLTNSEISEKMLAQCKSGTNIVIDEEKLTFDNESFDMIFSILNLHWTNNLPATLMKIRNLLKKEGLFIATIFGGETLKELRHSILEAEMEHSEISPRISPFVHVKDAGMLLQKSGFNLPVAASDIITVEYSSAFELMNDLKNMGETNALTKRSKKFLTRSKLNDIAAKYSELFSNDEGNITASFEIITLTGWRD